MNPHLMGLTPWHYTFVEHGGYDAMYSAYWVYDAAGNHIFSVDTTNTNPYRDGWDEQHAASPEALAIVERLVSSVNEVAARSTFDDLNTIDMILNEDKA